MADDRPLDLLLIQPGGSHRIYQNLSQNLAAKEPPIWGGLLGEYARRKGLSVEILDANVLDLDPQQVAERVRELRPALSVVVVYGHNPNASTFQMPAAGAICTALAQEDPEGQTLLLGGHVSALPVQTLLEEDAHFSCSGEGPITIVELVAALRANRQRPELEKVRGLVWQQGAIVVTNQPAPLVTDLATEMPGMAWDLLPMDAYRAHNWHCYGGWERQPYAALYTTLGCPFRCSFCCIQAPFRSGEKASGIKPGSNSYRRFDPHHVVAQIHALHRDHGIRSIKIADELFLLDKRHVEVICDGLEPIGDELNLWAYARVDTCADSALLAKMRRAGIRWLALGIESAAEHVRADVDKGYRPEHVAQAVDRVRQAGIHVMGNYIFGLPEDDRGTMEQTLDFALELNTEFANFFSAMAYPGSQLYREAVEKGWRLPDSWAGYSQHSASCLPLPTRHITGEEVLSFRDRAFVRYFDRPEYHDLVQRTFGREAVDEIRGMLTHSLPRQHRAPAPQPTPAR